MHCRRWFCCCEGRKYSIVAWFLIDKNRVYKSAIAWCLCIAPCCDYLRVNILPYLEKLTLNRNRVNYRKLNFWTCNAVWTKSCLKLDLLQVRMSLDLSSTSVLAFENFKAFFKPNAFPASTGRRGGPPCSLLRLLVLRGNAKTDSFQSEDRTFCCLVKVFCLVILPFQSTLNLIVYGGVF